MEMAEEVSMMLNEFDLRVSAIRRLVGKVAIRIVGVVCIYILRIKSQLITTAADEVRAVYKHIDRGSYVIHIPTFTDVNGLKVAASMEHRCRINKTFGIPATKV